MNDRFPMIVGGAIGVHALAAMLLAQIPEQPPLVNEPPGDPLVVAELEFIEEYDLPEPEPEPPEEPPPPPEPEVVPEEEPEEPAEPEIEPEPEPLPEPTYVAKPKPKPVVKPKPKPKPKPVAKPKPRPRPKPKPIGSTKARPKSPIKGRYPKVALRKKLQGTVMISASIGTNGRVTSATVSRSSGHASLDKAALRTVKAKRFHPATRGGRPVVGSVTVPINFRP